MPIRHDQKREGGSVIRAVGFDFDGTLIMSEDKKGQQMADAFREKFGIKRGVKKEYNNLIEKAYNRDTKVLHIFKKILKREPTKKEHKDVSDYFGKQYESGLKTCPLFQCTNILKELKKQVDFMFLLSLENKKEITKVAKHCHIAKYFDEILGGPTSKIDNLKHVIKKHKVQPSEMLYIGDSHSDVIATKKMKMKMVLLGKKHTYQKIKEDLQADFIFSSLCDVPYNIDFFT